MFIFVKNMFIFAISVSLLIPSIGAFNQYAYGDTISTTENIEVQNYSTSDYPVDQVEREKFYISTDMGWPVENVVMSSGWGNRESCNSCSTFHQGLDFTPGEGTNVLAAMNGTIKHIGNGGEYGVYVILEHLVNGAQWETVYAHLEKKSVPDELEVGQEIFIGDKLGTVGRTGLATGPHLHFEIRISGAKVNPLPLLKKYVSQDN